MLFITASKAVYTLKMKVKGIWLFIISQNGKFIYNLANYYFQYLAKKICREYRQQNQAIQISH
jgi:hypothetical protein